jgi:homopolymeric O-antigen transport system ATP-binding protein
MEQAIELKGVSKQYRIATSQGGLSTRKKLGEGINSTLAHPLRAIQNLRRGQERFWALKDITLNVAKGESVGIIGRNGAGKSTLLKLLSQITYPTEGEILLRGKVGSLLEVGTGFHPDLTGRENIYLNGAILGMRKRDIDRRFDDIVSFAEVERFLDTPIKRYSSGMYLRLAFSVAAYLEPDVLIADEVLAVGDQQFQQKCLGRMKQVYEEGRTVIFVSHNMHAIRQLCGSGVYLKSGKMAAHGPVDEVITAYVGSLETADNIYPVNAPGLVIDSFEVEQNGASNGFINGARPFEITVRFKLLDRLDHFRMGVFINNSLGDELFRTFLSDWDRSMEDLAPGSYVAQLVFPEKLLSPGSYGITVGANKQGNVDLLVGHRLERSINISAPLDLNTGGPADPLQSRLILDKRWTVERSSR